MKKSFFYWNWLARIAKASNTQRKAVAQSAAFKSPIPGKTAILAAVMTAAILLFPQTTGLSAQSIVILELPDLPDPGPVPEPSLPPILPGTLTCFEYYNGIRQTLDNSQANYFQAIERAYNAKCKPFNNKIDELVNEIDNHLEQIIKKEERRLNWVILLYPNVNDSRITNLEKEIQGHEDSIESLKEQISKLQDDLGKIHDWREKMVKWANEKHRKENEALEAQYQDCLDNERDDD